MSNIENKLVSVTFERDDFVKKVFKTIVTNTSTKARGKLKIIKTDLSDNTLIFRFRFYGKGITCDGTQNDRKRFRLRGKITIDQLADFLD